MSKEPVDSKATPETCNLFASLCALAGKRILFGHQDALLYGVGWKDENNRSDVKSVCGKHPAVVGFDFGSSTRRGLEAGARLNSLRHHAQHAHGLGALVTFSWHAYNPVTGGDFYDLKPAVPSILPGASHHVRYREELNVIADFMHSLKDSEGNLIPVVFRPFHEHNGDWFWWCEPFCTINEFIELWRFTLECLRDELGVHNLLYCYSPDVFNSAAEYLERYPGDEYVDILGHDNYRQIESPSQRQRFIESLRTLVRLADERGKIAALTETGLEGIADSEWWTESLWNPIISDAVASRLSWFLVWRNANTKHHYAPWPGHASTGSFLRMAGDKRCGLCDEQLDLYSGSEDFA